MKYLEQESHALAEFLGEHPRLVVLTGAGISLDSGIPTYRDSQGKWLSGDPIKHQSFIDDPQTRRRYWARSWYGWPVIRNARPNSSHKALAKLEQSGSVNLLITQNVDNLHRRAGSSNVIDLHGRVDRVRCLSCEREFGRDEIQEVLGSSNNWAPATPQALRPDGDMEIPAINHENIALPQCRYCDGDLMPDVVFFGGTVPRARVSRCNEAVAGADALLVVGSSLKVYSGFRFCRLASELGIPLAIINPGVTRADDLATHRFYSSAGQLMDAAIELL